MNVRQLGLAVALIIVLGIIYMVSSSGRDVQKSVDEGVLKVDTASVFKISVINNTDTISFVRGAKSWTLEDYAVNASSFSRLFGDLISLKVDRFVSQNVARHSEYEVDSTATRVMIYGESELLKDFFIGKAGTSANETFVRENGQPKVYTVLQNLNEYNRLTRTNYWNQEMINLLPEEVFSIQVEGDFNYLLEQKNIGWTYNGELMDMQKGLSLVQKLASQKGSAVSSEPIPATAMLLTTASITPRNGKPVVIKYFENEDKSTTVYVQVVGNPMRFDLYKSTFDGFNRKFEDLKPTETATSPAVPIEQN